MAWDPGCLSPELPSLGWGEEEALSACLPLWHRSSASLPMKVIGRKLGFLKEVRKADDRVGRSAAILLPPPSVCPAPQLRLQPPRESAGLSLLLSPRKAHLCLPFLGRAWGVVTTLPASLNPGLFVLVVAPDSLPPGPPGALWDPRQEGD